MYPGKRSVKPRGRRPRPAQARRQAGCGWRRGRPLVDGRSGQGVEIRTFRTLWRERHPGLWGHFVIAVLQETSREINMLEVSTAAGKPALGIFHQEGRKSLRRRLDVAQIEHALGRCRHTDV